MTTPPALMDSTPQNFYTYYSMLRSEPAQIPILLRFLHEQRSPEREGLAVTVTSCLTGGSIISAAQWNALLAAGLHRVYMDIILTDEIYHDVRTRKYLSMVTFGLGAILTNLTNKDEDSMVDHRNPIVADEVIDKTVELWDFV